MNFRTLSNDIGYESRLCAVILTAYVLNWVQAVWSADLLGCIA
jgi:hypothetical protein